MKRIHLICNAHIDPAWMWETEEGIAETLSTFRVAADFCDDYEGFVFNHNEAVLYEWVEEYDKELFQRIQRLVREEKWRIIGGAYLQPDCNIPSGEAMVRQILEGRNYFNKKFKVQPVTAINFDPFGHSRGLVQILAKTGYDSYIVCRPLQNQCPLPADDFVWRGYENSKVLCHRGYNSYESHRGKADEKIRGYINKHPEKEIGLVLWGVGNHGGGPSREDWRKIMQLKKEMEPEYELVNSYPEKYFKELTETAEGNSMPDVYKSLHYQAVGCYTSQIRVKQKYRQLENALFRAEKMCSCAALNGLAAYPQAELDEAQRDMLYCQFHDILPGSSIESVEKAALRQLEHGLEITERVKNRAFFFMLKGQKKAGNGEIPIVVFNPHPVKIRSTVICEFNLPDQNTNPDKWALPVIYQEGDEIPSQTEHEESNFNLDWRKRVVFEADLEPFSMNRYDCKIEFVDKEPEQQFRKSGDSLIFKTSDIEVVFNDKTGAIDSYKVGGRNYLLAGSFVPEVFQDDYDSWGINVKEFRQKEGSFELMSPEEGTKFSGINEKNRIDSLRMIEDGKIRSVVEAVMKYRNSTMCIRYYLPKKGCELQVSIQVNFAEKMKMLKLPIHTAFKEGTYIGQSMYGREEMPNDGTETISQRYSAVVSEKDNAAVTIINDGVYGSDCLDGECHISLLRSPGYSAGCSDFSRRKEEVMEQGRCNRFMDQGIREYTFWINFGSAEERMERVETEAAVHNERPVVLSCFPGEQEKEVKPLITLDDSAVQLTAFKKSVATDSYIIRLFEPTGVKRQCNVKIPVAGVEEQIEIGAFEIKTLEYSPSCGDIREVGLLEEIKE